MSETKATIIVVGDRSVGIPNGEISVEFNWDVLETMEISRDELKAQLTKFFQEFTTELCYTMLDDECGDCCAVAPNHRPGCPATQKTTN